MASIVEQSYLRHAEYERGEGRELPSCYVAPNSVDAWRHARMLECVRPIVDVSPDSAWLTVGDSRYGSDAHALKKMGAHATASSLTDATLDEAQARGYIDAYRAENAEAISLAGDSVDFVLCKESYHHFPRPPMALYEMLRVARVGVVMIEPMDAGWRLLDGTKDLSKLLLGRPAVEFEPAGNYLYRTNPKELRKLMIAAGYGGLAYRRLNDFYLADAAEQLMPHSRGARLTQLGVAAQDVVCRLGLMNWGLGVFFLWKSTISARLQLALHQNRYRTEPMPTNPYL